MDITGVGSYSYADYFRESTTKQSVKEVSEFTVGEKESTQQNKASRLPSLATVVDYKELYKSWLSQEKSEMYSDLCQYPSKMSSLTNQLPIETSNYRIEQADKCYKEAYVVTDKKSGQKLYLDENELVIQKDKSSGIKFIFDTSDKVTMQPKLVVDSELEQVLKTWMNRAGQQIQERQLEDYSVNTDRNTGIKYLTRNGQEGRGADILLLTDADRSKFEEIKNEYLRYPNIAENQEVAEFRAAMEVSGNSKRCADGVMTVVDGYISFTSYDGKKENSWSKILSHKSMYEDAYAKLQGNDLYGIGEEKFWDKFFDEMGRKDLQHEDGGTDTNIIVKPDGSRVLVISMKIGGMESTMSIKISDPTDFASNGENEQPDLQSEEAISESIENAK